MAEPSTGPHRGAQGLHRVEHIMGTAISIDIADDLPPSELGRLADEAFDWFRFVDARFSTYRPDSDVNRLDRRERRLGECAPETAAVLDRCARLWLETEGYFDVYATGPLDPSGYVKGWSVQVASDRLAAAGAVNHCVNAGGDVRVRGSRRGGGSALPWRVGVRHPWQPMAVCWVVTGTDLAVATSGTYERGCHVVDPYRRLPALDLRSVTVAGPDLGLADAYATAALAMGTGGLDWLSTLDGYACAVVTEDGRCFCSDDLPVAAPVD
jgi:FAD:protein FMN transferase